MYYVIKLEKPTGKKVVDLITTRKAEALKHYKDLRATFTLGYILNDKHITIDVLRACIVVSNKTCIPLNKELKALRLKQLGAM